MKDKFPRHFIRSTDAARAHYVFCTNQNDHSDRICYTNLQNILMFCAIEDLRDRSIEPPSIDRERNDRSLCANDEWTCIIDHPCPSIDACTIRHVED